jgi:hypothetical protein
MNKEWFIFKGTHHQGPYSVKEMEEFFKTGELTAQSLVWKEGAEKWEALAKTSEFLFFTGEVAPPAIPVSAQAPAAKIAAKPQFATLPNIPDDDLPPPMPPGFLGGSVEADAPDMPPPVPLDAILHPSGVTREFKKQSNLFSSSPKLLLGILFGLFAIVVAWFLLNEQNSAIKLRVKGIMPIYLEKLQETATQNTPSINLALALSLDGKTVFASTNKDGEILSIIKLKSLPKRTLGTEDVELVVRGVIKDHLGEFSRMQLTKGPQFVPGEYSVEFTGRRLHFLNRKFKFLNDIDFFKGLNTNYTYETQALIFAGTPREFEKKMLEYSETIVNEKLKPYTDKLERFQTFLSLLNKTVEDYLLALDGMTKPKDIANYEAKYIKEISPVVQSLVVEAHEISKKENTAVLTNESSNVATYSQQVLVGKQMGELASDMITETGKLKKLGPAEKAQLKTKFELRYKNIKTQIDNHIKILQEEIQKISG